MSLTFSRNRLQVSFRTDIGLKRKINQDAVLVQPDMGLFAVADGMGGHNAGEIASQIAVNTLREFIKSSAGLETKTADLLNQTFLEAHNAILEASRQNSAWDEMGTTLVVALNEGDSSFVIGHVGDSRAYRICQTGIELLTEDHTFLSEWIKQGLISAEKARNHPARHGLYMALGIDDEFQPRIARTKLADGDFLLLCSDGLTDMVEENIICEIILESRSLEAACNNLVDLANSRGGHDNISVIIIRQ